MNRPTRRGNGSKTRAAWAFAIAMLSCTSSEPPPTVASSDPAATALVSAMGMSARWVDPKASGRSPALWLLGPSDALPPDLAGETVVHVVEVARLDDLFRSARAIGDALDAREEAERWIDATRLDLARLSASSLGARRPHVAILCGIESLTLAGGASVETELLEIAGAESVTHGGDEVRIRIDRLSEEHATPELWLWIVDRHPGPPGIAEVAAQVPADATLEVFALPETWVGDPAGHAKRLRGRIEAAVARGAGPAD